LEDVIPQGNTRPFEFETQTDKSREDYINAKCTINVLSSHYQKACFRIRFRFYDIFTNQPSPYIYSNPIHVVSKPSLTSGKKLTSKKQQKSTTLLPTSPVCLTVPTPTIIPTTPFPNPVVDSPMMELLLQLQKGQEEQRKKLDEILTSKKRKRSDDLDGEEDLERAFENAFRLLKKSKTSSSASHCIHHLAHKYADDLQLLWSALSSPPSKLHSTLSPSTHTNPPPVNISDFLWSPNFSEDVPSITRDAQGRVDEGTAVGEDTDPLMEAFLATLSSSCY